MEGLYLTSMKHKSIWKKEKEGMLSKHKIKGTDQQVIFFVDNDQQGMQYDMDVNANGNKEQEIELDDDDALQHELEALEDDIQDYGVYADAINVVLEEEELPDSDEEENDANANEPINARELTNPQRRAIYELLLTKSLDGYLEKGSTRVVAEVFNVSIRTVQRIWKRAQLCIAHGVQINVDSRKRYNCGRKKVEIDLSVVAAIPLRQRSTIRSLADALGVPKSTLHRLFKEGHLQRHSNSLKPYLKEANKKERLRWCVGMLDHRTLPNNPKFIEMENIIHIDEKWFNATKKDKTYYLHPLEPEPYKTVQNKNAIEQVMFLSAVARPRFDDEVGQMGLDIRLVNQPPNSPDMNCLDLGFFASLQSLTSTRVSSNMEELIENIHKEYNDYNPNTLNRVFVTLQSCYIEVMKASGGNKYKIPHMNKERLEALGILPKVLCCDHQLYERAVQLLVD
ncbi:hypothetical protein OsJ_33993 [Oryza sativa Japonica Group]|uniref:DUF7769 domain-containing protein n=2 Tax=Oryza sativa subsp. japonica TaxID=39947 RepID=A0A8J8Y2I6_ORYSJ|nr:transposon protein, putative, Mariner sub-class [Oryza sativa Japonica Group]EEE52153.1 hypothetical protein OsJ_33993 [Oryza sativa Japonica Group]